MMRKLKENKAMAAIASVLILAAVDSVQSRVSNAGREDINRSRRTENWRKLMDMEQAVTVLSNKIYLLENPQKKPKR